MNQTKVNNFLTAVNVLIAIGLIVGGYFYFNTKKNAKKAAPPKAPQQQEVIVNTAPAIALNETHAVKYVGLLTPEEVVEIVPRVTGFVKKQNFSCGDHVKAGQLLYEIEDTDYIAAVATAKANVEQCKADLLFAEKQLARNKKLQQSHAVADSVLDDATRSVNSTKARLAAAEASLVTAENNLSYTKIYAPINGIIDDNNFDVGNLVTPGSGVMTTIRMVSPIRVKFAVGEMPFRKDFGGMQNFANKAIVKVVLADGTTYPETAKIASISPSIDNATNTITVWGNFENKDFNLISGGYATVMLSRKLDKPLTGILLSSLLIDNNGSYVYVVNKEGKAERRDVKLGGINGDYQEILSGVNIGEIVVADGTHKVTPGAAIKGVELTK